MKEIISKQLLSEVLGRDSIKFVNLRVNDNEVSFIYIDGDSDSINIYQVAHKNLKQWAKRKNVFGIIDWSEEPEQIFKKAEELRNELNKRPRDN